MPETKGLTLEEMDEVFGDEGSTSAHELERQAEIAQRIGLSAYAGGEKGSDGDYAEVHAKEKI